MAEFIVPNDDLIRGEPWPTLGGQICDFIEERAIFGPGDLKGQPAVLDDEKVWAIYKAYEIYPSWHPRAGKRRHRRVRYSWRKGTAKTEFGGWMAYAELHPEGPVRFDGWDASGNPVGRPVSDPYIPMLAYTEKQVMELAYGVLYTVCTEGPDADLFDSSLERVARIGPYGIDGKAVPLATSPNSRDGARTTLNFYDETHRLILPSHLAAYETMEANLPKRPLSDPWSLGVTTAGVPGQGSVAELDKKEAEAIAAGDVESPELFYYHREAGTHSPITGEKYDLTRIEHRIAAIEEASGPSVAAWSDIEGIARQWDRHGVDKSYLERVWLNRWTQSAQAAFDSVAWAANVPVAPTELPDGTKVCSAPPDGAIVSVGLDGSRWKDTTAIVVTDLNTMIQHLLAIWVPDEDNPVDLEDVDATMTQANSRWKIVRAYCDPALGFDTLVSTWQGRWGGAFLPFETDSRGKLRTAYMCKRYAAAIESGECKNDGNETFAKHVGAAQKRDAKVVDEQGHPMWTMTKDSHGSENKIDAAMAGGLSWQAALDAIAKGANIEKPKTPTRVYTASSTRRS